MLEDRRNYISIELFYSIVFSLKCTKYVNFIGESFC